MEIYIITNNYHRAKEYFRRIYNLYNKKYLFLNTVKLQAKVIIDNQTLISIDTIIIHNINDLCGYRFNKGIIYIDSCLYNNEDIFQEILCRSTKDCELKRLKVFIILRNGEKIIDKFKDSNSQYIELEKHKIFWKDI